MKAETLKPRGVSRNHTRSVVAITEKTWPATRATPCGRHSRIVRLLLGLCIVLGMASPLLQAQTFQSLPALSFTKVYAGGDPTPQVITAASTEANFQFFATAVSSTGGNWLMISPGSSSGVQNTPRAITVPPTLPSPWPPATIRHRSHSHPRVATRRC